MEECKKDGIRRTNISCMYVDEMSDAVWEALKDIDWDTIFESEEEIGDDKQRW